MSIYPPGSRDDYLERIDSLTARLAEVEAERDAVIADHADCEEFARKLMDERDRLRVRLQKMELLVSFVEGVADEDVDSTHIPQDIIEEAHELLAKLKGNK